MTKEYTECGEHLLFEITPNAKSSSEAAPLHMTALCSNTNNKYEIGNPLLTKPLYYQTIDINIIRQEYDTHGSKLALK
jgi:hypothetical protein